MEILATKKSGIETVVNANNSGITLIKEPSGIGIEIASETPGHFFALLEEKFGSLEVIVPLNNDIIVTEDEGLGIEGSYAGGVDVKVCLDSMFGHTHDTRYHTKEESLALIGEAEGRANEFTARSYENAVEAQEMLRQSLLATFTESISPITVQTMSLLVGAKELQFRYVGSKTNPTVVPDGIVWNGTEKKLKVPAGGIIQHMTLGITTISSTHSANEYRFWNMALFSSTALSDGTKKYWLYAKVRRTGDTSPSDLDTYILSEFPIAFEDNVNYPSHYCLLVGLLSSEVNGERSWITVYGFTEVLPGRITVDKIVSPSGKTYFDLSAGDGEGEIGGKIKFVGTGGDEKYLSDVVDDLQEQIDGQVIAWFQEHDPTLGNYPASEWTTDELKNQHLNDTFTNISATSGRSWRFTKVAGVYSWTEISDTATTAALLAAAAAQDTADGKKRVFTTTPAPPYDEGDLWSGLSSGDLKVCITSRATGNYVASDWALASKYTDDTAANAAQTAANNAQTSANTANSLLSDIASDSKLTPVEKQSVKLEWDVIVAEKSKIDAQADYYGVSKTAYGSAYSTLNAYISPLLANLGATSNITGTTFRSNFAAYYAARQDVLDAIAEAAKDLGDLANANAIGAALVNNPNLIRNGYRMFSSATNVNANQTSTLELTKDKTYTFSAKGTRYSSSVTSIVYIEKIINGQRWVRDLFLPTTTESSIASLTFVCPETGIYNMGFYFVSNSATVCEWAMLQEGKVYIDQNTAFKQTAEEEVTNKENLLLDSKSRTIEAGTNNDKFISISFDALGLKRGALYTFSIESSVLTTGTATKYSCIVHNGAGSILVSVQFDIGTSKQSITFRSFGNSNTMINIYAGLNGITTGNTLVVDNLMLQYGPFSTPWRVAVAETAEGVAAGVVAKAKTDGFTTIEGGLITTNVIKLGDANNSEKAFVSGITQDNLGKPLPAFGAGGTYIQAIAGTSNVIIWHNGVAKFGQMRILTNGTVVILDTQGKVVIELRNGLIDTVADLQGSAIDVTKSPLPPSGSVLDTGTYNWDSSGQTNGYYTVTKSGTSVTVTATLNVEIANSSGSGTDTSYILLSFYLSDGTTDIYLGQVELTHYLPTVATKVLNINETMNLDTGTYYLKSVTTVAKEGNMGISYNILSPSMRFVYNVAMKRNIFGKDGFLLSYDGDNFIRQAISPSNKLDIDLFTKGRLNMPGLLACGYVSAGGSRTNRFGNFPLVNVDHTTGSGIYVCKLEAPNYNFVPVVTAFSQTAGVRAQIYNISSYGDKTFTVRTYNASGALADFAFCFTVFGDNQ
jgi:hypothetical protein